MSTSQTPRLKRSSTMAGRLVKAFLKDDREIVAVAKTTYLRHFCNGEVAGAEQRDGAAQAALHLVAADGHTGYLFESVAYRTRRELVLRAEGFQLKSLIQPRAEAGDDQIDILAGVRGQLVRRVAVAHQQKHQFEKYRLAQA